MSTTDTPPAQQAARLPEAPEKPVPVVKTQVTEALEHATRTQDPRAIAQYLELRRAK